MSQELKRTDNLEKGCFVIVYGILVEVDEIQENGTCWGTDEDGDDISFNRGAIEAILGK